MHSKLDLSPSASATLQLAACRPLEDRLHTHTAKRKERKDSDTLLKTDTDTQVARENKKSVSAPCTPHLHALSSLRRKRNGKRQHEASRPQGADDTKSLSTKMTSRPDRCKDETDPAVDSAPRKETCRRTNQRRHWQGTQVTQG
mmetsp:Transcript_30477/g.59882  ORF Transcript_30477/g.59882 Transcript_30477/m.59882 type:complete len:144 (-) Transcript_30477:936-1367(-)